MSKKQKSKQLKMSRFEILSLIFMLISIFTVIYYMLGPSEGYLHSDCVDTMTWAGATVDSGKLFSESFYYPYLLPFGSTFLVYPFVKVFGFSMFAYRFSMLVFMALFSLAVYFTVRGMNWGRSGAYICVGAELLTVSSSVKLRELFWEHIIHYSLGAFLAFVLLALVFYFIKNYEKNGYKFENSKKTLIFSLGIGLWCFFSAFDGLTTLTLSSIPVIGGIFLAVILDMKNKIFAKANKGYIVTFAIVVAFTAIGSIFLKVAAGEIGTGYGNAYSVITDSGEWSSNIMKFLQQWSSLLGADYRIGESITKFDNILAAVKLAGSLVIFILPIYGLFIYNRLNKQEQVFLFFHWVMTAFILYGYVFGKLSSVNWRLSPIICSAVVVNVIVCKTVAKTFSLPRAAVLLSAFTALSCVITFGQIVTMPADYGRDDDHHKAIELLEKNNLEYGYATYWNANVLTLLSSSSVQVRDVNIDEDYPRNGWLNCDRLWYFDQPDKDRYFFLLTRGEYEDAVERNHVILQNSIETIEEGNWVVVVYDRKMDF